MPFVRTMLPALLAAGAIAFGSVAQAQDYSDYNRGRNVSVLQRERPDYQAIGLHEGGFTIFPRIDAGAEYTSNVFKTENNTKSDVYAVVDPSLQALSNWGRHQLRGEIGLRIREFASQTSENELGWYVSGAGRLDVHGESYLTANADIEHTYLRREDEDFPLLAAKPLPFTIYKLAGRGVFQANRLRTSAGVSIRADRYDDVPATTGGRVDDSGRDLTTVVGDIRGDYALTPDKALFLQGFITNDNYRRDGGVFGPSRDSNEYKILGGASFDVSALLRGEIGVGYFKREYDSASFGTVSGLALNGSIEYFPTQLTTLTLKLRRDAENSILQNAGGYIYTGGSIRVDHELLRNLLLKGSVEYAKEDFEGIDRRDSVWTLTGGGTYFVNHTVGISATAMWIKRDSTGANALRSFDDARLTFAIVLQR